MTRQELIDHIKNIYSTDPEYPWNDLPDYAVFRHKSNKKWFAVIMNISKTKLGINSDEKIDILNIKCDPILIGNLRQEKGFFPAYHMNKTYWVTVALDGTVESDKIKFLLDLSYDLTDARRR